MPLLQAAPERIDGLAAGRADSIEAIAKDRAARVPPPGPDVPALGYGLSLGVSCREDYPFATQADLAAAGSFDTLTSLAGAEAAAAKLSKATIISIPAVGHVVASQSPCAQTVITSFLADPGTPDTSCVGTLKPPSFTDPIDAEAPPPVRL